MRRVGVCEGARAASGWRPGAGRPSPCSGAVAGNPTCAGRRVGARADPCPPTGNKKQGLPGDLEALVAGAHVRDRTGDLILTKNVLYLLSYMGGRALWGSPQTRLILHDLRPCCNPISPVSRPLSPPGQSIRYRSRAAACSQDVQRPDRDLAADRFRRRGAKEVLQAAWRPRWRRGSRRYRAGARPGSGSPHSTCSAGRPTTFQSPTSEETKYLPL